MSTPRSPDNNTGQVFLEVARLNSMSTKNILLSLAHAPLVKEGVDIKVTDPIVRNIARFELLTAQSKSKLNNTKFDNSKSVEDICNLIQANIDQLGKIKNTAALSSGFAQELTPFKSEMTRIIVERDKIAAQLEKLLTEKNTVIEGLIKLGKDETSQPFINRFKQLQKIQNDITAQTTKLLINEKALRPKLDALAFKAVNAAKVAGVAVEHAPEQREAPGKP